MCGSRTPRSRGRCTSAAPSTRRMWRAVSGVGGWGGWGGPEAGCEGPAWSEQAVGRGGGHPGARPDASAAARAPPALLLAPVSHRGRCPAPPSTPCARASRPCAQSCVRCGRMRTRRRKRRSSWPSRSAAWRRRWAGPGCRHLSAAPSRALRCSPLPPALPCPALFAARSALPRPPRHPCPPHPTQARKKFAEDQQAAEAHRCAALGEWEWNTGSGYYYNAKHRWYYDTKTSA